ncbi:MAG TPA: hypothetical protein VFL34_11640 [Candidatus Sulfotelmatobacter sp.]|nr:hypothetical protein [Candidatus Sulfotelmatobacter sp.]
MSQAVEAGESIQRAGICRLRVPPRLALFYAGTRVAGTRVGSSQNWQPARTHSADVTSWLDDSSRSTAENDAAIATIHIDYGDAVTDGINAASLEVGELALHADRAQTKAQSRQPAEKMVGAIGFESSNYLHFQEVTIFRG